MDFHIVKMHKDKVSTKMSKNNDLHNTTQKTKETATGSAPKKSKNGPGRTREIFLLFYQMCNKINLSKFTIYIYYFKTILS
jgi:hypothetical protein